MNAKRVSVVAILLSAVVSGVANGQGRQSADPAERVLKMLRERKLQQFAAKDPAEAGRYVAATIIGDTNLLLVSARYAQPVLLNERLYRGDHQGAYAELNAASIRDGKLFVQDLGEPGLRAIRPAEGAFDIVYRSGGKGTLFDGNWKAQGVSKQDYLRAYEEADSRYTHALGVLLSAMAADGPPVAERP